MPTTPPEDPWGMAVWVIGGLVFLLGTLAVAVKMLFNKLIEMYGRMESLVSEVKELMGQLLELIRANNTLQVEVKDVMKACKKED